MRERRMKQGRRTWVVCEWRALLEEENVYGKNSKTKLALRQDIVTVLPFSETGGDIAQKL